MRVNPKSSIAGYPIKRVCDFLRHYSEWQDDSVESFFKTGPKDARRFSKELIAEGFATAKKDRRGIFYQITLKVAACPARGY